jgi:hypothetical protein
MEEDLKKISGELMKASGMHKGQAKKIDNLLERKDNKSIAKMIKGLKNSNCGSPSKALVFQPKNLNQHLDTPPPKKDTGSKEKAKENGETVDGKEPWGLFKSKSEKATQAADISSLKAAASAVAMKKPTKKEDRKQRKEIRKNTRKTEGTKLSQGLKRLKNKIKK